MTRFRAWLRIAAPAMLVAIGTGSVAAATPSEFSIAERRLFVDDHLRGIHAAATLEYTFSRRGSLEGPFDDTATLRLGAPASGGGHPAHVDFLSDARHLELPDLDAATSNPVILFFLEREVREMQRLTGGSANYYRKRIRMALAEGASVQTVTASVGSRQVTATQISIAPYRDDPARPRYERFAEKSYVFTLSNDVPGNVVEMRSELLAVPGDPGAARDTVSAEVLRFARMH
jgi:hypothetical protein